MRQLSAFSDGFFEWDLVHREGYPCRMGKVIIGVIVGFILFPILLIWLLTSIF